MQISPRLGRQSGVALLATTVLLVVVGTSTMLDRLNQNVDSDLEETLATSEALAVGKAVLLAYAITSDTRPGELPCPDVDYDGEALVGDDYSAATGNPCNQLLGWLPYVTLSSSVIEDGSGARLWYALSDDYHEGGTGVLNSEVSGQLDLLDGGGSVVADDIVAVIIAPGVADGDTQYDRPGEDDSPDATDFSTVADFLEGVNADTDLTDFSTSSAATLNDRVMVITRSELMQGVEKRVLGEVAVILDNARSGGIYPWLKSFEDPQSIDPAADEFRGEVGTREGLLPLHVADEDFDTTFTVTWNMTNADTGVVNGPAWLIPDPSLVIAGSQTATVAARCVWLDDSRVDCDGRTPWVTFDTSGGYPVQRRYRFSLGFTASSFTTSPPTATAQRTRGVSLTADPFPAKGSTPSDLPSRAWHVRVQERHRIPGPDPKGRRDLRVDADTLGTLSVSGIWHDLYVDVAGEVPVWIVNNNWHHLTYTMVSEGYVGTGGGACGGATGDDCLSVNDGATIGMQTDVEAIVVAAGSTLSSLSQNRSSSPTLDDYFEGVNATTGNNVALRDDADDLFNDQVRVVVP